MKKSHIITLLVENQPGVLARVVGLISGRGYNIETLNVGPTQHPERPRMTMTVPGDDHVLEQVTKQLYKLVDVIEVSDLTDERHLNRELVLVEVAATEAKRGELVQLAGMCDAAVISVQDESLTMELADTRNRVADFIDLLKPYTILDLSRSGVIAVSQPE
jgi:acetolactate synthase-1/3 small subunit